MNNAALPRRIRACHLHQKPLRRFHFSSAYPVTGLKLRCKRKIIDGWHQYHAPCKIDLPAAIVRQCAAMKAPRFLLRGFRRPSEVALLALGKLERQVLDEAWQRGEVSVRDIYLAFGENIAYTTLMTTLDRLFRKQLLDRRKDGRAFLYAPAVSREEFEHGIREDVIDGLLGKGAEGIQPVLACIVDTVSERDRELLDELDRLVKEKKRELRRQAE